MGAKRTGRLTAVVGILLLLFVFFSTMPAYATSVTQDGLELSLISDKESYVKGDSVTLTLTVNNTSEHEVTSISLENVAPDGFKVDAQSQHSLDEETLLPGATLELRSTFVPYQVDVSGAGDNESAPSNTASPADAQQDAQGGNQDSVTGGINNSSSISGNTNGNSGKNSSTVKGPPTRHDKLPITGDDSVNPLLILLLAVLGIALIAIGMLKRRDLKKNLMILVVLTAGVCMYSTQGFAATGDASRVDAVVDGTIIVDGNQVGIKGLVRYTNPIVGPASLERLAADETAFVAGHDALITFTVVAMDVREDTYLYDSFDQRLGKMHDDGLDGDASPNDGVLTLVLNAMTEEPSLVKYRAKAADVQSNEVEVRFYEQPTIEEAEAVQAIEAEMLRIEARYANEQGITPLDQVPTVMEEVAKYVESLRAEGIVLEYETGDTSIIIRFSNGFMMTYSPTTEGFDSIGSNVAMAIATLQPCLSMYDSASDMSAVDDAAQAVARALNNYSLSTNLDNSQVTLDAIKNLRSNQVVLWHGHGGYSSGTHSYLLTGEDFDWHAWWWDIGYCLDNLQGRVLEAGGRACITPKFVKKYCGNLDNDLVYLAACQSGKDSTLADAFLSKGASAVVANSETIYTLYNVAMESATITSMVEINPVTSDYYTLSEALDAAKASLGNDDIAWARTQGVAELKSEVAEPLIFGGDDARNYQFASIDSGTLIGKVCKAVDRTVPVAGAKVLVYASDQLIRELEANGSGDYRITLPVGSYRIEVKKEGYVPFTAYAGIADDSETYLETFLMVEGSQSDEGIAKGSVYNALTGQGIEGVSLTVRKGWSNSGESNDIATITTGRNGAYEITLPYGNYTLHATKSGYVSALINIVVQKGDGGSQNGAMTPVVSGDTYRVVLTWGENPRDLDSHVEGTLSGGSEFHVYYGDKSIYDGGVEVCNLDVDDTSSYGPETITLNPTTSTPYYYYIYRYAGSGTVASSGAQVKLYQGDRLLRTFNVPTDLGNGDYWNVFAITRDGLVVRNTITSSQDVHYA